MHGTPCSAGGMLPLSGGLLPLPQWHCTFAAAFPEGYVACLVVGLCRRSSHGSPSSSAAPFSIVPLLLSSLDSCHRPLVAPQPPTIPAIHWHAFIALCHLLLAAIVLRHIQPLLLVYSHGFGICCPSLAASDILSSAAATQLLVTTATLSQQPPSSSAALLCYCSSSAAW